MQIYLKKQGAKKEFGLENGKMTATDTVKPLACTYKCIGQDQLDSYSAGSIKSFYESFSASSAVKIVIKLCFICFNPVLRIYILICCENSHSEGHKI